MCQLYTYYLHFCPLIFICRFHNINYVRLCLVKILFIEIAVASRDRYNWLRKVEKEGHKEEKKKGEGELFQKGKEDVFMCERS